MADSALDRATASLKPGQIVSGFLIHRVTVLPALAAVAIEAQHQHSGARLLHLVADDDENLFAVAFRTPPPDDTGVPHILEHSVLGGSEKYPVKEPFVELLKSSMATFINAMTYGDKTVYPVASNVRDDYFNLMAVYCDAVVHPRITPMTLKQEGHRLAFAQPGDPASPLTIQGIVYNEMRGAYSDLDSVIGRTIGTSLFPDTPYGRDSGGDPAVIPTLTYEQFVGFFKRYYHPANSQIFLYGNIPTEEQLAFLDERLCDCPPPPVELEGATEIPRQKRWQTPRVMTECYPIGPDDDPAGKTAVTVNWLVGSITDPVTDLALDVVDQLLLGSAAAPLRKALVDSQLGRDLTDSGYSSGTLETTFHVGLKGTDAESREAVVAVILDVLGRVCDEGFSPERVKTAFNQLQYSHREIQSHYPLRLMNWVYNSWLYDPDPLTYLRTGEFLGQLEARYAADPDLFVRLIRTLLLDNPHRTVVTFEPDPTLQERRDREGAEALASRKAQMSSNALAELARESVEFERLQDEPNTAAALATLPRLPIAAVPAIPKAIPVDVRKLDADIELVTADIHTNGIGYLALAFDLGGLPEDLWAYVPVFCSLFSRLGTQELDYTEVAEQIASSTGGISAGRFIGTQATDPDQLHAYFTVNMKALDSTFGDALGIVERLLTQLSLDDTSRLRDVLKQSRERALSQIVPNGHQFAVQHAARVLSEAAALSELWGGLPFLRLLLRLSDSFEDAVGELRVQVNRIRKFLLSPPRLRAAFTGGQDPLAKTTDWLGQLTAGMPSAEHPTPPSIGTKERQTGLAEGLAMAADVAFCTRAMPAPHVSHPDAAPLGVLSQLVSYDYLWEEVRAKGGAYGGFCSYNGQASTFELMSYRDPHIDRTLDVYDRLAAFVAESDWDRGEVERAIIACAKGDETPIRPGWATSAALWHRVCGLTESLRQERRQRLLAVTGDQIRGAAERLFGPAGQANTCVLASRERLAAAQHPLTIHDVIPPTKPAALDPA